MPQNLDQIAAAAPEDVKIASERICAATHIRSWTNPLRGRGFRGKHALIPFEASVCGPGTTSIAT